MNATSNPAISQPESFGKRLRHLAIATLFALVMLIPKIVHMRSNPRSWMLFRIFLGVAGAALLVLPLCLGASFVPAIVLVALFGTAILLPPANLSTDTDDTARELAAQV